MEHMTELERFIAPLRFFKLWKNQSLETNRFTRSNNNDGSSSFSENLQALDSSEFHVMLSWM